MGSLLLAVAFLLTARSVPVDEFKLPGAGFAEGWAPEGPQLRFSAHDLYGHIDGGAELFLEFGFQELHVQDYRRGEGEIALELYRMAEPKAALGIYLMKCGQESASDDLPVRHSAQRYQITFVQGAVFGLVNNFAGDPAHLPAMLALAREAAARIPAGGAEDCFASLPVEDRIPGSERILRGPYGLESFFTLGRGDILGLGGRVFAVLADYEGRQGEDFSRLVVDYPYRQDAVSAFTALRQGLDPQYRILEEHEDWFSFEDSQGRFGSADLRSVQLTLKLGLIERPSLAGER